VSFPFKWKKLFSRAFDRAAIFGSKALVLCGSQLYLKVQQRRIPDLMV
jgi:hypothetical protein